MKFTKIKTENSPRNTIRLPRMNKIRLGIKKTSSSGKEYPAEVDYFVVPPEIQRKFGDKPKTLPVMIPVEDEEKFLREYYAVYGSNQKLKCQGDGDRAERRDENGKITEMACPSPENCDFAKQFKCHARIDLMLVLPEINMGGVYQLSSGSVNTSIDVKSGLEMARYLFGRVAWVPMVISREERKIPDPDTGRMQTHWPVRLYPIATVSEVNQIRGDTQRIIERSERFSLPEPVIEGEFTAESEPEEKADDPAPPAESGVDLFVSLIEAAGSSAEIDALFRQNRDAINKLAPRDKAKVLGAKNKKNDQFRAA